MTLTNQWEQIAGKWKQIGGELKKKWGKLTDDELMQINGSRDILAGKLQEKYGLAKEDANKQIDEWAKNLKMKSGTLKPDTVILLHRLHPLHSPGLNVEYLQDRVKSFS